MSGQAARLSVLIEAAQANSADFLILDTAPNADQTALRAAQIADVVLIPCRAATFDLEAIQGDAYTWPAGAKALIRRVERHSASQRHWPRGCRRVDRTGREGCAGHAVATRRFHAWGDRRSHGTRI